MNEIHEKICKGTIVIGLQQHGSSVVEDAR
jgi:hypothetical protein